MNSPRAKRLTSRRLNLARWGALAWLLGAPAGFAVTESIDPTEAEAHAPAPSAVESTHPLAQAEPLVDKNLRGEMAGYARLAKNAVDESKWPLADHYLQLIADLRMPKDEKKEVFLKMADAYEAAQQTSRAVAIYEKMVEAFPHEESTSEILFKLGMIFREKGAPKLAVSRFYSVLNSALKTDERGLEGSRELAKRAQWEIAQTYFLAQDFPQARKFYELFARLELTPEELARVRFKIMHCRFLLGDLPATVEQARKFIADFPDHPSVPECRYVLANALRELKQPQESMDEVIALLREEKERREKAPEQWVMWQKRAGNEFANRFYGQGDFLRALTIYQALARLGETPDWQWPVIYQMGLCFERLKLTARAAEAYKFIIEDAKKPGREPEKQPEGVRDLPTMARWRGEQLAWRHDTDALLNRVIGPIPSAPALSPALSTTHLPTTAANGPAHE